MNLAGKTICLGVSGGIAAYKACALTSKLTQKGADVHVIMTKHAAEFVTPLTFQALSRNPVYMDTFDEKHPEKIAHIDLADKADIFLLAPATANLIGKLANGIADDMLTTTLLATEAPVYIAPAMNVHMYAHPAVIRNVQQLDDWGYRFIEPEAGYLACGYVGKGRLEEPESIIRILEEQTESKRDLEGKRVLITAGPTQESVDPVRFFTNHSSGKMGYALAEACAKRGADVTLVSGPTQLAAPQGVKRLDITSAQEMLEQVLAVYEEQDIVIKAAAVADYRPARTFDSKMKKKDGNLSIEMERTTDILQTLGQRKQHQFLVGFAAETDNAVAYGKGKLERKRLDAICVNTVGKADSGFQSDTNEVIYLNKVGKEKHLPSETKKQIAHRILDEILEDMEADRK
ncbi:bifunctional phosphopantothenoylcysteine decarboxylase/phosphopantothenate--cysteine ligase CoaBC [Terribacillus sp. 7520-G]|uniref:bifunctional phosphopantothenoylcysteine decarboxylase/phosphopantothenate--cysteine ligase CoaBC n=1 Tax=Terribacillus TaxID=459532 RepID=UPI000BA60F6C|nr:bifunctional phosphopantothenoylcysteine decarboxylase/phosphopantothenate--cysteine ligase CoaBC [Terribacillus sp. 7520-G]PAD40013.1 bifunctional phosphopantothenoylcysteine decarboxylase/phosphopantothenate--cysteine ligase CoaBC [Terribacillus sp. 7520-G]